MATELHRESAASTNVVLWPITVAMVPRRDPGANGVNRMWRITRRDAAMQHHV
jgi:hypothetical protein